jgi:hypothetical protein
MNYVRPLLEINVSGIVIEEMVATPKTKKQMDIEFGRINEQAMLPIINRVFGEEHHKEKLPSGEENEYDRHDFWNTARTKKKELKTRRIRHDEFATAVVNHSKIVNQDPSVEYTYIWKYTDGCYYLPYDADLWKADKGFYISSMRCWRDGVCEEQPVMNVPRHYLIPLPAV